MCGWRRIHFHNSLLMVLNKEKILSYFKNLIPGHNEEDYEIWRTLTYDAAQITGPTTNLFQEDEKTNFKAVTAFTERDILDFLFSKYGLHHLLLDAIGISKSNFKLKKDVRQPLIANQNEKPGDLDIVLFNSDSIHKAIGIEAKCVKVRTLKDGKIVLNKEHNITKGITQVNSYLQIGFHRTILLMILLDDGQHNKGYNQFFRDTDLSVSKKLFNQNILKNLHQDIGLIYLKVNQITGKSIFQSCKISVLVEREAKGKKQKASKTEKLTSM